MSRQETVLVIGGGVIGIACAHYLSRAGYRVTLIDKGELAAACSQGNCGYVCPSHVLPLTEPEALKTAFQSLFQPNAPFRVQPRLSPALWHWFYQFARRCRHETMLEAGRALKAILDSSMAEYRELIATTDVTCEWQDEGLLYVFRKEAGLEGFGRNDALLQKHFGVSAQLLTGAELVDFEPALRSDLAGAYFYSGDAHLRPDALNQSWVQHLRDQGVTFHTGCALQSVRRRQGRIDTVQTSQGELRADHYVFAMGAWSGRLGGALGCRLPVEPGKGYSVTMDRPRVCPTHPMLLPETKVGVTPFDSGYRLGSMMEFVGFDERIPPQRIQQLRDSAEPYLLEPHTASEHNTWYGWRPMTWDSLPIIGAVPKLANGFLATGHNMLGLSLAPATGRLLTELVQGQKPHLDPEPFRPDRF